MKQLTIRQRQVLDYIQDHSSRNGYPPTLREIAGKFRLSGPRAAVKHLQALERKGHIRRTPGSSRGIEVLFQGTGSRSGPESAARDVPILGTVPAGPLDLAVQEDGNSLILDPSIAGEGTFLLKVKGDSMTGDHILPGDLVLVQGSDSVRESDLVVVLIGDEATLKRFRRDGEKISLLPSNPEHRPVVLDGSSEEIRIVGKIRAVIRITAR